MGISRLRAALCAGLTCASVLFCAPDAKAGPLELFNAVLVNPADTTQRALPYYFGGAGMFISNDDGKSYGLLCSRGIDASVYRSTGKLVTLMSGAGALFVGATNGLWRGDQKGCGFTAVPELDKRYVGSMASDPLDPQRTYVATANNGQPNSLFVNDGKSLAFSAFGAQTDQFLNTLHVVKRGAGRRFYETGVKLIQDGVQYIIRVSDDDAATWTDNAFPMDQFGMPMRSAELQLLAVDPQNPDVIVARISRTQPGVLDSLVYSPDQGKPGSWQLLAEVTALDAVAFGPDGALYFGDNDQNTKGLYVVQKPGDMPKRLSDAWKVGCLSYDAKQQRMLACNDYLFGAVDLTNGRFTPQVDMRCAQRFVDCPGQPPLHDVCETQALADFCNLSHFPIAPACQGYDQGSGADAFKSSIGYTCQDGLQVQGEPTAGSGGAPVTSAGSGGSAAAGSGGAPATTPKASGGCSVSPDRSGSFSLGFALLALAAGRCRRARRRAM
jgi:hypothetical protein